MYVFSCNAKTLYVRIFTIESIVHLTIFPAVSTHLNFDMSDNLFCLRCINKLYNAHKER